MSALPLDLTRRSVGKPLVKKLPGGMVTSLAVARVSGATLIFICTVVDALHPASKLIANTHCANCAIRFRTCLFMAFPNLLLVVILLLSVTHADRPQDQPMLYRHSFRKSLIIVNGCLVTGDHRGGRGD